MHLLAVNMAGLEFYIWLSTVVGLVVLLLLMYLNSLRKARRKTYYVPGECFGALLCRSGGLKGRVIRIRPGGIVFGRVRDACDIVCSSTAVSREHAKVFPAAGRVIVVDLKSKNGTYVNGRRIVQYELANGDIVTLGKKRPATFEYRR